MVMFLDRGGSGCPCIRDAVRSGLTDLAILLVPSLKRAFDKLYGYTSDADGIRHALLEEDSVTFEQAKFMLVVCSAFTNCATGSLK
jgi:hypothetical protein